MIVGGARKVPGSLVACRGRSQPSLSLPLAGSWVAGKRQKVPANRSSSQEGTQKLHEMEEEARSRSAAWMKGLGNERRVVENGW